VSRIREPGSGAFLTPGSGMGKISTSGSGMNNLDHISESLETFFVLKFFSSLMWMRIRIWDSGILLTQGPESGIEKFGFGIWINIPDPQQWEKRVGGP
jgi:hypothetical protein